jgi:hypothetical protein
MNAAVVAWGAFAIAERVAAVNSTLEVISRESAKRAAGFSRAPR